MLPMFSGFPDYLPDQVRSALVITIRIDAPITAKERPKNLWTDWQVSEWIEADSVSP